MSQSRPVPATGRAAYPAALLLGLLLAWWVFPLAFVLPPADVLPSGDMAQHVIAQRSFIAEPWGWPPLRVARLAAPDGINIAFLDGIPLLALPLKAIAGWLPEGFHGIGLWHVLAWVLQPVAAVFCLRGAGERRLLPALAFAVIACAMPTWWNRFGHPALGGHFLLLLALGGYVRLARPSGAATAGWLGAGLLLLASLLVHPYLFMMVAALLAAVPVTLLLRRRAPGRATALLGCGLALAVAGAAALLLGYGNGSGTFDNGYGLYSMNLLSPVWPHAAGLLPPAWRPPPVDAAGMGGWEGYNWLGFGVWLGLLGGLLVAPAAAARGLRHHAGLGLALLALALLAVGFKVGLGQRVVLDLGMPPDILLQFRASGRLFWPVGYAAALAAVLLLARGLRAPAWRAAVLLGVAALQGADAAPLRQSMMARAAATPPAPAPEVAFLRRALPGTAEVTVLPSWNCIYHRPGGSPDRQEAMLELIGAAAAAGRPVSTMYAARPVRAAECEADARAAAAPLRPGELRVLVVPSWLQALVPGGAAQCRPGGRVAFCRAPGEWPAADWPLPDGFDMRAGGAGTALLLDGWAGPEDWGVWSEGAEASLALPGPRPGTAQLRLTVQGYAPRPGGTQPVSVLLDGRPVAQWLLEDWRGVTHAIPLPPDARRLTLRPGAPTSPAARGEGQDTRRLGLGLKALELEPEAAP